jgi:hypothetical protein
MDNVQRNKIQKSNVHVEEEKDITLPTYQGYRRLKALCVFYVDKFCRQNGMAVDLTTVNAGNSTHVL